MDFRQCPRRLGRSLEDLLRVHNYILTQSGPYTSLLLSQALRIQLNIHAILVRSIGAMMENLCFKILSDQVSLIQTEELSSRGYLHDYFVTLLLVSYMDLEFL